MQQPSGRCPSAGKTTEPPCGAAVQPGAPAGAWPESPRRSPPGHAARPRAQVCSRHRPPRVQGGGTRPRLPRSSAKPACRAAAWEWGGAQSSATTSQGAFRVGEVNPRARPESAFRRADSVGFSLHLRVKITQSPSVLETRLAPAARTCVWAPCTAAGAADAESGGCSARGVWTRGTGAGAVRGQAQPGGGPGQPAPQHSTPSARGRRRPASAVPALRARSDQAPTSKPAGGSCEAAEGRSVALTRVSGCPTATEPAKRKAQRPRLCCRPRLPEPRDARASARVLQKRVSMRTASRVSVRVVPTATVQRKPHVLFGHQSPTFVLRGASFICARTWGSARARLWFRTPAPGA